MIPRPLLWLARRLSVPLARSVRIKSFGYRLLWMLPERWRKQSLARTALLRLAAAQGSQVFFMNIGANDGLSGDPLREFIFRYRWRGVLVEPVPYIFHRLVRAYAGRPGLFFEQAALGPHTGTLPFWTIRQNDTLPPGHDQIGSFDRRQVLKHAPLFPGLEEFVTCVPVPCLTFADLLRKYGLSHVDLVLSDVEGADAELVRQILQTDVRPRLILYEEQHLSATDRDDSRRRLRDAGYSLSSDGVDVAAWRESPPLPR